jgi:thymidylate synthase
MVPGKLIWITGDTHIYLNNVEAAEQLIKRSPREYPILKILKPLSTLEDILSLEYTDIKHEAYVPIKPQISVVMNE